jgi:hypothetical protein
MGEWSKKIGEYGEKVVEIFFSIIGWNDLTNGEPIPCLNPLHVNENGNPKNTHGIDFLYSYNSQLVSGQLTNVIISTKYKTVKYPNSPTLQFKSFMDELIETLECFDGSELKDSIVSGFSCSSINDVGVLFWLNNQADSNDDLIRVVASARFSEIQANKAIYLMDNKRVAFILQTMSYVKMQSDKFDYFFYYPNTGQNINPMNRENYGKMLPVEYLNSTIIPIKLVNKYNVKETCLFLATLDSFEEEDLIRLIGLSKDISADMAGEVIIAFPDYEELLHKSLVTTAKQKYQSTEFTKTVRIVNYNNLLQVF